MFALQEVALYFSIDYMTIPSLDRLSSVMGKGSSVALSLSKKENKTLLVLGFH